MRGMDATLSYSCKMNCARKSSFQLESLEKKLWSTRDPAKWIWAWGSFGLPLLWFHPSGMLPQATQFKTCNTRYFGYMAQVLCRWTRVSESEWKTDLFAIWFQWSIYGRISIGVGFFNQETRKKKERCHQLRVIRCCRNLPGKIRH